MRIKNTDIIKMIDMIEKIQNLIEQYNTNHLPDYEMRVVFEHNEFVVEVWNIENEKCTLEESFLDVDKMIDFMRTIINNSVD